MYTVLETNYRTDPDRKSHIKSVEQKLPVQKDCDGGDSGCTGQPDQDNVEKICTALGVTLSQFFQEGNSENLTEKQKEVLGIWNNLSTNEQETVMSMLRGLRK